jgi:serine/threonine protein kinase
MRLAARARLVREAQALARLSHPNIVEIYDVGTYDPALLAGQPSAKDDEASVFVVMEFLEGKTLARWVCESPRTWREICDIFGAAGRGLAAAHARGIVHRDFKPTNVMVGSDDRVRVLDFGLARPTAPLGPAVHPADAFDPAFDESLTASGAMLGTPAYMAPEQHDGDRADARSDQYAFCLALYESLYGCSPYPFGSIDEFSHARTTGRFLDPPPGSSVPAGLLPVLRRGLAPEPNARFPSMEALLDALSRGPRASRRRQILVAGCIAAAAIVGAIGVYGC